MPTTTARQCASRWGISEARARSILAPVKPVGRDTATGAMLYDEKQAEAARSSRPGRGTRNDRTVQPVSAEQFERLIKNEGIPAEHRALWALLRDGHTRITDALSLDVRDVDLDQGTARINHPKLSTDPKVVPISERTVELLRRAKGDREAGPLISGAHGRPLSRETATRVARQAGATSIHAFRPQPHKVGEAPRHGVTEVPASDVRPGDVVYLDNGRSIKVDTVQSTTGPDGQPGIEINVADGFPFLFVGADELLTIAERREGP